MTSDTIWDPYEARPKLPAWIASMLFHAALLLAVGLWIGRLPEGAAEETGRSAGIVLKKVSAEGVKYEGESDQPIPHADAADATQNALDSLPEATAAAEIQASLPQLPTIGAGALAERNGAKATDLATGGGARSGRPGGGGGGEATVAVFGVKGSGHKFVYAFDRSISMDGAPLRAAKEQLLYSLASLDTIHQFQILFFNHKLSVFDLTGGQNRIAFADEKNLRNARAYVEGVSADGGTDREAALLKALAYSPDVIFFLTDADDPMSVGEVQKVIQRARRAGTAISVIEFGRGSDPKRNNFLVQIARETGGQYGYVDTNGLGR